MRISVVTPTYNRANVLYRVFESLQKQTVKDFEWIVVDDGSTDDTRDVVEHFIQRAGFRILYMHQDNNGKHIAVNEGVKQAQGDFVAIADSDDEFTSDAFEIMLKYWDMLDDEEKESFRGVTCRCFDPDTGEGIGTKINGGYVDYLGLDATYKYGLNFEMWGINRRDLMLEYAFPDIRGGGKSGLRFFPETVIWDRMGKKYKVRYIDDCLRAYYRDQENATTSKKTRRSRENIYLWEHLINEVLDYARYMPLRFVKAFIGMTMDGLLVGERFGEIVAKGAGWGRKALIVIFAPIGVVLYLRVKKE